MHFFADCKKLKLHHLKTGKNGHRQRKQEANALMGKLGDTAKASLHN